MAPGNFSYTEEAPKWHHDKMLSVKLHTDMCGLSASNALDEAEGK